MRKSIDVALVPLLEAGEELRAGASVWMADRRRRVPLLVTSRALYFVAVTDRRLLVFDTPRRGRPLLEADLLLTRRLGALTLRRVANRWPLRQVRVGIGKDREVVFEFRPRDRAAGQTLVDAISNGPASARAGPVAESGQGVDREAADEAPGAGPGEPASDLG